MAQQASEPINDGKAEAEPRLAIRSRVRQLVELAEYALALILRNAGAGIANIDAQLCGAAAATHHYTAARRIAHRVGHQIEQDAFKQDRIAAHPRAAWHDAQAETFLVREFGERRFDAVKQPLHGKLDRILPAGCRRRAWSCQAAPRTARSSTPPPRRCGRPRGPTQIPDGCFSGAHLALPITTDRRLTTDRHGPFHAGEVRALARARCAAQSFSSYGRAVPPGRIVVDAAVAMPLLARSLASCTLLVASAIVASYGMVGVRACMRSRPRAGSLGDALQWPRSNSPKRPPSSSGSSPRLAAKIEMPARLQYSICPCRPALAHVAH